MLHPLIEIQNLTVRYYKRYAPVLNGLSLEIMPGEILGILGQSGCGKSTLAKALVGIIPIEEGTIWFGKEMLYSKSTYYKSALRKEVQLVFQDPTACLNPRMSIEEILVEPLMIHEKPSPRAAKMAQVKQVLRQVGLNEDFLSRYPHELSGGQKQRVCIARSLILKPRFIIFDEAVSALDASIQAQILNLLKALQKQLDFTLLFISHDLEVVRYISNRVAVMQNGKIVEMGDADILFKKPKHPYTQKLIALTQHLV